MRLACTGTYTANKVCYQSSLKERIHASEANNERESGLNCAQYRRLYSLSLVFTNSANVFGRCRCISFSLDHVDVCTFVSRVTIQTYWKLRFVFSFFVPFAVPCLRARTSMPYFSSLCARHFLFRLSRYKICSNAKAGRNTKDKIPAKRGGI